MKSPGNLFRTPDGRSFGRSFLRLCALFLLSGVCEIEYWIR